MGSFFCFFLNIRNVIWFFLKKNNYIWAKIHSHFWNKGCLFEFLKSGAFSWILPNTRRKKNDQSMERRSLHGGLGLISFPQDPSAALSLSLKQRCVHSTVDLLTGIGVIGPRFRHRHKATQHTRCLFPVPFLCAPVFSFFLCALWQPFFFLSWLYQKHTNGSERMRE